MAPADFGPNRATIQQAIFGFYLSSVHAAWRSVMGVAFRMKIGQLAYVEQPYLLTEVCPGRFG
jgi:hypothetical protein